MPTLLERIVNNGDVRWGLLGTTIFGGALLAFLEGVVSFTLRTLLLPSVIFGGLTDFAVAVYSTLLGTLELIVAGSWASAAAFVANAGLAGFVLAVVIVVATVWIGQEVLERA